MAYLTEYLQKINTHQWGIIQLKEELKKLVEQYNKVKDTQLLIYTSAIGKNIPGVAIEQSDFYFINDLLSDYNGKNLDIYIETPGGSGEATEEIVRWLRKKYDNINFIVAGEAKSAGTLMTLSGNEIYMSETGSLGPIDAQVMTGRMPISAHDYKEWVESKRKEAENTNRLNPVDIAILSQITPGEISGIENSLYFAEDLVEKWLVAYKFKNWNETETKKTKVTEEMKQKRAKEIAKELTNHTKWRSHGRSLKVEDLEEIGLKINKVEEDKDICEIVYRMHALIRLIFETSTAFKLILTEKNVFERNATPARPGLNTPIIPSVSESTEVVNINFKCEKCGSEKQMYCMFKNNAKIEQDMKIKGIIKFPNNCKYKCECGHETDLLGLKNAIELNFHKKML